MNNKPLNAFLKLRSFGFSVLFALLLLSPCASVYGEVELGNYGAVAFDPEVGFDYTTNIALNSDELDDFIFFVRPLLRYRLSDGAVKVNASAGFNLRRYDTYSENDADNFLSSLTVIYPNGEYGQDKRFDFIFDSEYKVTTLPNASVQAITKTRTTDLSLIGRYFVTERTFVRSGFEYFKRESLSGNFEDITEQSIPVEFFYRYSEDLNLGLGYQYKTTGISGSDPKTESTDHAFFVSAEGRILPSVVAEVRVGMEDRNFDDPAFSDENGAFVDMLLSWEMSEQTTVELSGGNEFSTAIDNTSAEVMYVGVEVLHTLNDKISGRAGLFYEESDYSSGRNDEEWALKSEIVYTLIENISVIKVRGMYGDRTSSRAISNYDVFATHFEISYLF